MKERYLLEDGSNNGFSLITDYDGNDEQAFDVNVKSGEILPVLPLRNMVLFPGVFLPITVGRKSSLKLIRDADKKHKDCRSMPEIGTYRRSEAGGLAQYRHRRTNCADIGNARSNNDCHPSRNETSEPDKHYRNPSVSER